MCKNAFSVRDQKKVFLGNLCLPVPWLNTILKNEKKRE
jgi:hypothetical protein